jgi:hypothetical protein
MASTPQWVLARKNAMAQAFAQAQHYKVSEQLYQCSETLQLCFCTGCDHRWYVVQKCRLRICPICAFHKSVTRKLFLDALCKDMAHPKFITLTMPLWSGPAREGIKYLRGCFTKLRRTKLFKPVKGGAYQIELKEKETGWHIHMHLIADAPYLPQKKIFAEWRRILDVPQVQVDIRSAASKEARAYICKYVSKAAEFKEDPAAIVRWYEVTKGLRLWATFGDWYNITPEELLDDDDKTPWHSECPCCGSQTTIYFARDGPWAIGHAEWNAMESYIVTDDFPITRPIDDADALASQGLLVN